MTRLFGKLLCFLGKHDLDFQPYKNWLTCRRCRFTSDSEGRILEPMSGWAAIDQDMRSMRKMGLTPSGITLYPTGRRLSAKIVAKVLWQSEEVQNDLRKKLSPEQWEELKKLAFKQPERFIDLLHGRQE